LHGDVPVAFGQYPAGAGGGGIYPGDGVGEDPPGLPGVTPDQAGQHPVFHQGGVFVVQGEGGVADDPGPAHVDVPGSEGRPGGG